MTHIASRAAWAAAGALTTAALAAAAAVHWARACARTEQYGTHMRSAGGRITGPGTRRSFAPVMLSHGGPVASLAEWGLTLQDVRRECTAVGCCSPGCAFYDGTEGKT